MALSHRCQGFIYILRFLNSAQLRVAKMSTAHIAENSKLVKCQMFHVVLEFLKVYHCYEPCPAYSIENVIKRFNQAVTVTDQTMASFPLKATSVVGPNGKSCDGTEPEKPCTGVVMLEQPNADTITITWDIRNSAAN